VGCNRMGPLQIVGPLLVADDSSIRSLNGLDEHRSWTRTGPTLPCFLSQTVTQTYTAGPLSGPRNAVS